VTGAAVTGLILAGGRSRRMGRPKATIRIDGLTLIERVAQVLAEFCDPVLVVGDDPVLPEGFPLTIVPDAPPGGSVIHGLLGGLQASPHDLAAVVGCDMPYLKSSLLKRQVEHAIDYDLVLLANARGLEPLHGIYRRTVIPALERLGEDRSAKLRDLWGQVRGLVLDPREALALDPEGTSAINLNTPEELRRYTTSGQV
jgi:molybdopterin-guanine dinucleotide biosynthesis protein A